MSGPWTTKSSVRLRLEVEVFGPVGGWDFAAEGHAFDFGPGDERETVEDQPGPIEKMSAVPENEGE